MLYGVEAPKCVLLFFFYFIFVLILLGVFSFSVLFGKTATNKKTEDLHLKRRARVEGELLTAINQRSARPKASRTLGYRRRSQSEEIQ